MQFQSILDQVRPSSLIDIGITALLIYWLYGYRNSRLRRGLARMRGVR